MTVRRRAGSQTFRLGAGEDFVPPWGVIRIGVLKTAPTSRNLLELDYSEPLQEIHLESLQEMFEKARAKALLEIGA